jgi:hypothetical protein
VITLRVEDFNRSQPAADWRRTAGRQRCIRCNHPVIYDAPDTDRPAVCTVCVGELRPLAQDAGTVAGRSDDDQQWLGKALRDDLAHRRPEE